jgi:aryl-alcohol dehydrogenase-like predicted oxidoreductase
MEMRFLGSSGLRVSALAFGTMTFGGTNEFFRKVGSTQIDEARQLVDLCLEAGVNLFDTADVYSQGASEEILGQALSKRRDDVILATKVHGRMGDGPNDVGQSRHHIIRACEDSLRRLGTDYIDLYQVHGFDALTPLEETLGALDDLVRSGKVRYIGCSNYSAWHLMKALCVSERKGLERFVSQQVYYSLVARELEYELVPLSLDQGLGILVWSPLAGGFLSGKFRRGQPGPEGTRRSQRGDPGTIDEEKGYDIVDVLEEIAREHDATIAQAALNWVLHKPGVTSVIVGARTEEQLRDNLAAASWEMTEEEVQRLDEVSATPLIYPYWHQRRHNSERIPQAGGVGVSS